MLGIPPVLPHQIQRVAKSRHAATLYETHLQHERPDLSCLLQRCQVACPRPRVPTASQPLCVARRPGVATGSATAQALACSRTSNSSKRDQKVPAQNAQAAVSATNHCQSAHVPVLQLSRSCVAKVGFGSHGFVYNRTPELRICRRLSGAAKVLYACRRSDRTFCTHPSHQTSSSGEYRKWHGAGRARFRRGTCVATMLRSR